MKNRILVTGGTGFIGKEIVKELVDRGYKLRCLIRKMSDTYQLPKNAELWYGDITNISSLKGICKNIDIVIHLAARTKTNDISRKYDQHYKVNVLGTQFLLEEAIRYKVKHFIHFSTVSVVGILKDRKKLSIQQECNPQTPYEQTKYQAEKLCEKYSKEFGMPLLILRPTMVYDFNEPKEGLFDKLVEFVKLGIVPMIGNGKNIINIIERKKLVNETIKLLKRKKTGIYVLNEENISMNDFINRIKENYKKKNVLKIFIPIMVIYPFVAFVELMAQAFNFTPFLTIHRLKNIMIS